MNITLTIDQQMLVKEFIIKHQKKLPNARLVACIATNGHGELGDISFGLVTTKAFARVQKVFCQQKNQIAV